MERYDVTIIGAGPGGYVAAIRAAQLGKKVALVEEIRAGGTCLNRGCIPTKALMHTAEVVREIKDSRELGVLTEEPRVDFSLMHKRKEEVVEKLVSGVEGLVKANGIDFYQGRGRVIDKNKVEVTGLEEVETLDTDYIILATGSRPLIPPIPGLDLEGVITSDQILLGDGVETDSLIIIGGGVIGVEIACIYNALGAEVTIIEAMERILPNLDKEISQNLSMILKKRGVNIFTGARVEKVSPKDDGLLSVEYTAKEKSQIADGKNVLVSIGRKPNTENLISESLMQVFEDRPNMPSSDGKVDLWKGFISCREDGQTGVDNIYAVGDIVLGGIQLAHAASAEGVNAVESIFEEGYNFEEGKCIKNIPSGVYTDPEIASVGITEGEAKDMGIPYKVGKAMTGSNGKTLIESGDRGYVKLIFAEEGGTAKAGTLLGAQIVSKRATDMIGGLAADMTAGTTLEEMARTIWPHPTFSEVIGEAIEDALDGSIHAMPKKKR